MKLGLFLLVLLVLAVFSLIILSLLFYLRHWAFRHTDNHQLAEIEGRYFKRYIPEQLRGEYDKRQTGSHHGHPIRHRSRWAKLASVFVLFSAVTILGYSLVKHLDTYLSPIDLTSSDIARLDYSQHHWKRIIDNNTPDLKTVLRGVKPHKLIIPFSDKDNDWLIDGVSLRRIAISHWQNFIDDINFSTVECKWKELDKCLSEYQSSVVLVLPGYWDFSEIDKALNRGASILVYGPPAQLFKAKENELKWSGLDFKAVLKNEGGPLILRGDQLLTLGFDAGLIIDVNSPFGVYQAFSDSPQAVSIGYTIEAGGDHETRLFAKTTGSGRLVWMDFTPSPQDSGPSVNVHYLRALMASIFRYLSKQSYSALATWPDARRFSALIEEDTEDKFAYAQKVLKIANSKSFPISWYILSNEALKNRQLTQVLAKNGEIGCHGDNHGVFTKSSRREQRVRIARCQKVLRIITGITPHAFRPPEEEYNSDTVDAIINAGMDHYIANRSPDRAVPEIQLSEADGKTLVSIPRMVSDDYELWHTRDLDYDETIKELDNEISWMHNIHGLYMFSFHSQFMKNKNNLHAIAHIIDTLQKLKGYYATSSDIAQWWRFRSALQHGSPVNVNEFAKFEPVILAVNDDGKLRKISISPPVP